MAACIVVEFVADAAMALVKKRKNGQRETVVVVVHKALLQNSWVLVVDAAAILAGCLLQSFHPNMDNKQRMPTLQSTYQNVVLKK